VIRHLASGRLCGAQVQDEVHVCCRRPDLEPALLPVEMPVEEMFWGERYGVVADPFGHRWAISTAREQLTPDDISSRTPPEI
jgi:uncharacterized glyoxalase superfamily protein PhnB